MGSGGRFVASGCFGADNDEFNESNMTDTRKLMRRQAELLPLNRLHSVCKSL